MWLLLLLEILKKSGSNKSEIIQHSVLHIHNIRYMNKAAPFLSQPSFFSHSLSLIFPFSCLLSLSLSLSPFPSLPLSLALLSHISLSLTFSLLLSPFLSLSSLTVFFLSLSLSEWYMWYLKKDTCIYPLAFSAGEMSLTQWQDPTLTAWDIHTHIYTRIHTAVDMADLSALLEVFKML